jgi:hypothetical protein
MNAIMANTFARCFGLRLPYAKPGRYTVAIKVIDIFGNDTMTLVPVNVG